MRVYLNKYKNHWISPYTICEKICFWREIDYDEPWVKVVNTILEPVMTLRMKFLELVCPRIEYVKLDRWDTWSMDHTLALIVLPMLKQLQETKHGAPSVDDEDVPDELKSTSAQPKEKDEYPETDNNYFKRWDWVLNEMIWAFEQELDDSWEDQFIHGKSEIDWKLVSGSEDDDSGMYEMIQKNPEYWVDREGIRLYNDRINNGMRLFGKYYRGLWD